MATSQITSDSEVATQRDIDESQELQDRGIRKEFQTVRMYMEINFDRVRERFQEQHNYIDERFQQVDERFQQVDDRLQDLEVLMKNSRATTRWHDIFPVRDPLNRYRTPPNFPDKVIKFWQLQKPRHRQQLVELLRFYKIEASDLTTARFADNDDSESESSTETQLTLEEAVRAQPAVALASLAARLGLDYTSIRRNMILLERIEESTAALRSQRAKREQPDEDDEKGKDVARPTKKAALSEFVPAPRSGTGIPLEKLLEGHDEFPYESPPAESYVVWDSRPPGDPLPPRARISSPKKPATQPSDPLPSRASTSSPKKPATQPSQLSKDSTIPFTHTPSVIKGSRKTTSSEHSQASEETSSQASEETSF